MAFSQGQGFLAVGTQLPALFVWDLRDGSRRVIKCTRIELREYPVCIHTVVGTPYLNIGLTGSEVRFHKCGHDSLSNYRISAPDLEFGKEPTDIVAGTQFTSLVFNLLALLVLKYIYWHLWRGVAGCRGTDVPHAPLAD